MVNQQQCLRPVPVCLRLYHFGEAETSGKAGPGSQQTLRDFAVVGLGSFYVRCS